MNGKEWHQEFFILCQEADTPDGPVLVKISAELSAEPIKKFKEAHKLAEQYMEATGVRVFILKALIASVVGDNKVIPIFSDALNSHFKE